MMWFMVIALFVLIGAGFHVATTLSVLAFSLSELFAFIPLAGTFGQISWSVSTSFILVAAPLFILMGELLLRSGVSDRMYRALDAWVSWLPGGLMHTNIAACAMFAASSGSSAATAATIGTLAMPHMERHNYYPPAFLGSLAAGGTLGILIPPSVNMIVYGLMAEVSIPKLYLAGFIPGFILAFLFSMSLLLVCIIKPEWGGDKIAAAAWRVRLRALVDLVPPIGLFLVVVGSIYLGLATPTEAAALGVMAALALCAFTRVLSIRVLLETFVRTMRTSCMIIFIVLSAFLLNFVMVSIGLTQSLVDLVTDLNLSPVATMVVIIIFFLVLGCVVETFSMMVAMTPVVVPIVVSVGYDPVWFGVVFMILIETGLITPPIGINLFVIQGIRGSGPIKDVIIGAAPFVLTMLAMIGLLLAFPQLALWLPEQWNVWSAT